MEDLIKALNIFLKYGNKSHPSHCEHDIFHIDISPEIVSKVDIDVLNLLGFYPDESGSGFDSFRFGSC